MTDSPQGQANSSAWYVYLIRCSDNSLYTGVTTDLQRRLLEHNSPVSATRYTRSRQPVLLVYAEPAESRSSACSREYRIKKLPRSGKEALLCAPANLVTTAE